MSNESGLSAGSAGGASQADASAVGQTANIGRATSVSSGAAKVFREFKWGLLALFLLMAVVIGLVYDGGRKKKTAALDAAPRPDERNPGALLDSGPEAGLPPVAVTPQAPTPEPAVPPSRNGPPTIIDVAPPPVSPAPAAPPRTLDPRPSGDAHLAGSLAPPKPETPPPPAQPATERSYTVVAGDTLTSIASTHLPGKSGVKALLEANKGALTNPDRLRVGQVLRIPAAPPTVPEANANDRKAAEPPASSGTAPKTDATREYQVQNGDTLERIARKLFNDGRKWRELFEWNRDQLSDPGRLRAGQVLKVKQAPATRAAATLPAPAEPRASADDAPQPAAPAAPPAPAGHSDGVQVMSSASPASLP